VRIKLLIATDDSDYAEHLSENIAEHHEDAIEVSVCKTQDRLRETLKNQKYDAAILSGPMIEGMDLSSISLPLLLWADDENSDTPTGIERIPKYQRISSMVAGVLERYAKVRKDGRGSDEFKANITAVWSPAGGVGKTTVALAFAAMKASAGKQVMYLNLEPFSSVPVYFTEAGKSISAVFDMLENNEGNVKLLIRGIRSPGNGEGISYFCRPDNYDDLNILSTGNIYALATSCAAVTEELIIDMSSVCDERARQIFELADRVLLVTDQAGTTRVKVSQFMTQHNVFDRIREKLAIVANKGATTDRAFAGAVINLPFVQSTDETAVYKTLSACNFDVQGVI